MAAVFFAAGTGVLTGAFAGAAALLGAGAAAFAGTATAFTGAAFTGAPPGDRQQIPTTHAASTALRSHLAREFMKDLDVVCCDSNRRGPGEGRPALYVEDTLVVPNGRRRGPRVGLAGRG